MIDSINSLIEIQNTHQIINKYNLEKYNFSTFKKEIEEFVDFYLPFNNISKDFTELSMMANKLNNGLNKNEVQLISKNVEKSGFFEKFFQLFS